VEVSKDRVPKAEAGVSGCGGTSCCSSNSTEKFRNTSVTPPVSKEGRASDGIAAEGMGPDGITSENDPLSDATSSIGSATGSSIGIGSSAKTGSSVRSTIVTSTISSPESSTTVNVSDKSPVSHPTIAAIVKLAIVSFRFFLLYMIMLRYNK